MNQEERDAKLAQYIADLEHGIGRWHLRLELARMLNETPDFAGAVQALARELCFRGLLGLGQGVKKWLAMAALAIVIGTPDGAGVGTVHKLLLKYYHGAAAGGR